MSPGAIDPFEEFLRKKKVEMLEEKYRHEQDEGEEPAEDIAIVEDDVEHEEKLREEMDEFFQAGQEAGAEYFSKLETNISEEKVEEIKDALEEVFEEDLEEPRVEEEDDTFVEFFKQVQDEFPDGRPPPKVATPEEDLAAEIVRAKDDAGPEIATPGPRPAKEPARPSDSQGLNLAEILSAKAGDDQMARRLDLLCRLVAKLVERSTIPENEIIEVLIKSGVEF